MIRKNSLSRTKHRRRHHSSDDYSSSFSSSSDDYSSNSSDSEHEIFGHLTKHRVTKQESNKDRSRSHRHKQHKHKVKAKQQNEKSSSPVQLSKFFGRDKEDGTRRSAISGKKILLKHEKSKEDKLAENNRN